MDLLERLQLEDLPEQQTRTMHLMNEMEEPPNSLGFENCAHCGTKLTSTATTFQCQNCRRISYCSEECRHQDANAVILKEEEDGALGHTAVICSLLKLSNEDDAVDTKSLDTTEAARDRVRSEYESYASTLANVLSDGPCYQECIQLKHCLTIHLIGASDDAELTRGATVVTDNSPTKVIQDYAEACAELAERNEIRNIQLCFIGPDCPETAWDTTMPLQMLDKTLGNLTAKTYQGVYHDVLAKHDVPRADIVVLFHPGFTVPDYDQWGETLAAIPPDTPFLLTSNTEMEAIADTQYLLEQDSVQAIPAGLADILEVEISNENSFFAVNPFHGMRVRQNQSMANDVFVKNRWMLGGMIGPLRLPANADERPAKRKVNAGLI